MLNRLSSTDKHGTFPRKYQIHTTKSMHNCYMRERERENMATNKIFQMKINRAQIVFCNTQS